MSEEGKLENQVLPGSKKAGPTFGQMCIIKVARTKWFMRIGRTPAKYPMTTR